MKLFKIVAAVAAVVAIGIAVGWWSSRGSRPTPTLTVEGSGQSSGVTSSSAGPAGVPGSTVQPRPQPKAGVAAAPVSAATPKPHTPVPPSQVVTNWEDKVDEILGAEVEDPEKAKRMVDLFPSVPEDGQVELAQHMSNLVPDENYASLAQYLTNAAYSEQVLDVLLADVLNRPNGIKLPALVDVASNPQHPKAGEAKDILELFLEQDYGTDWATWKTKVDQWLKDNPD